MSIITLKRIESFINSDLLYCSQRAAPTLVLECYEHYHRFSIDQFGGISTKGLFRLRKVGCSPNRKLVPCF